MIRPYHQPLSQFLPNWIQITSHRARRTTLFLFPRYGYTRKYTHTHTIMIKIIKPILDFESVELEIRQTWSIENHRKCLLVPYWLRANRHTYTISIVHFFRPEFVSIIVRTFSVRNCSYYPWNLYFAAFERSSALRWEKRRRRNLVRLHRRFHFVFV